MDYCNYRPLKFKCTACGRCCHGDVDDYIMLNDTEAERIRQHLSLTVVQFTHDYLCRLPNGGVGIRILASGRCSLLGDENKCTVYEIRPVQCRSYPFWPELVSNKSRWKEESRRCEGINNGDVLSLECIEEQLKLSSNNQ